MSLERGLLTCGVVIAADATGLAGWDLDIASSYAATREQFGKPIGAFQGVKHKCAEMLVRLEQARATTWDAARALDEPVSAERDLSSSIAIAVAVDAHAANAKDCVKVLGGIAFPWDHYAHLLRRRALPRPARVGGHPIRRAEAAANPVLTSVRQVPTQLSAS